MPSVRPSLARVSHTSQGETAEGLSFETAGKWGGAETIDGGEEALAEVEREETSLAAAPRLPGYQLVGRCWAQHQRFWNLPARDCMAASCKGHIDVSVSLDTEDRPLLQVVATAFPVLGDVQVVPGPWRVWALWAGLLPDSGPRAVRTWVALLLWPPFHSP